MFDLHGRVAVVTGASAGLGYEMAKALAGQGADVAILARREWKLEEVAKEIRALGRDCLVVKCDVTDMEQVTAAAEKCIAHFGKVDILVNNAGGGHQIDAAEGDVDEWLRIADWNLNSVYRCCRAATEPRTLPMRQPRAALLISPVHLAPSGPNMVSMSMLSARAISRRKQRNSSGIW